jgi:hypothetical protein
MTRYFDQMRRAGFDVGVSAGKLTKMMIEVLLELPADVALSKESVVLHLGLLGQMAKTRDINTAWNQAKRQIVRLHPERFALEGKILRRASAAAGRPRPVKLTAAGQRRLATLAAREGLTSDDMLDRLIDTWRAQAK